MPSERSMSKARELFRVVENQFFKEQRIAQALDEQIKKDAKIAYNNNDSCNGLNCNKRFNIEQAILSQLQPKKGEI